MANGLLARYSGNGEGRNRTADTTIFSRVLRSLELREIPGNHAVWLLGPDRQDHRKFRQIPADPGNDPPLVAHWRRLEVPERGGKRGAVSLSQLRSTAAELLR
jgi:hypothetical protein